jgi:predicted XRE-type DNA-binding protein
MRNARKQTARRVVGIPVEKGSGNVFEDLDVPESAEMLAKAELAAGIAEIISERGLTQAGAAKILGVDQPSVSDLIRGRLRGFSSDRLFRFLNALGRDVEILISPKRRSASSKASVRVVRRRMTG